jgi:DNA-binding transcriptional LysR family regulator
MSADTIIPEEQIARLTAAPGLTLRALEVFVAVARSGTMSAAAQQLGMTQPAVSQAIGAMEAALNRQLFDRSKRPLLLTMDGATLVEPARALVGGLDQFRQALRWGKDGTLPLLRLGMLNSFAETIGPAVFTRLRSVTTQMTIDSGYSATRIRSVADRLLDFAITSDESPLLPGLIATPILTEPFLIVAPHDYPGDPNDIRSLGQVLDLIRFGRDPLMNARFDQSLQAHGASPTRRYHLDTHAAVLEMVASGVGWTILPPLALFRAIANGARFSVAPYPEASMRRVMMLIAREGEGATIVEYILTAATNALQQIVLPGIRERLPDVAAMMLLHRETVRNTPPSLPHAGSRLPSAASGPGSRVENSNTRMP